MIECQHLNYQMDWKGGRYTNADGEPMFWGLSLTVTCKDCQQKMKFIAPTRDFLFKAFYGDQVMADNFVSPYGATVSEDGYTLYVPFALPDMLVTIDDLTDLPRFNTTDDFRAYILAPPQAKGSIQ